jgi:hypothetical protein
MPWECPACRTPIRYEDYERVLSPPYRCHVCELELVIENVTDQLVADTAKPRRGSTSRVRRKAVRPSEKPELSDAANDRPRDEK